MNPLDVLAALLVLFGVVNAYFLWQVGRLHWDVSPRSPLVLAMLVVAAAVYVMGAYFTLLSLRYLLDVPGTLPFGGIGLALVILMIEVLPAFIWWQVRRFIGVGQDRDQVRDDARDEGRDSVRDPARDNARDVEHDATNGP